MQKILGKMRKICEKYALIEENDKIAVGVSGGKDSLVLLSALKKYQQFSPVKFDLVAISIDLSNGEMDYGEIKRFCESISVPFYIEKTNVFEVVFDIRKEKNPCSLCANLRRGHLNSMAKELGCNKVALGHHSDDLIETFVMSLFFEGRLFAFQPKSYLSRMDLHVIRPLLFVTEDEIESLAKDMPVIHNVCPANHATQREKVKELLSMLDTNFAGSKEKFLNAITNPDRYNLWENVEDKK